MAHELSHVRHYDIRFAMLMATMVGLMTAVLACWLGLSLLVRAPRDRPTQAFAWLCLHLTIYGLTTVLPAAQATSTARGWR